MNLVLVSRRRFKAVLRGPPFCRGCGLLRQECQRRTLSGHLMLVMHGCFCSMAATCSVTSSSCSYIVCYYVTQMLRLHIIKMGGSDRSSSRRGWSVPSRLRRSRRHSFISRERAQQLPPAYAYVQPGSDGDGMSRNERVITPASLPAKRVHVISEIQDWSPRTKR